MKSYLKLTFIFLFTLGIFLLQTPSSFAGLEHNIRGEALAIGGAYEDNEHSLMFSGANKYVNINQHASHDVEDQITVSAWIKWNGPPAVASYVTKDFQTRVFSLYQFSSTKLRFWVMIGGSWIGEAHDVDFSPEPGNWYHLVGVKGSSNQRLYINSVEKYDVPHHGIINKSSDIAIGGRKYGTINGEIYDVRIYNRAFSAEEVDRLYRGVEVSDTGLVGHWRLDEDSGDVAYDSSENNNDGTLVNGPTWSSDIPEIRDRFIYFNCLDEPTGSFPYTFTFPLGGDPCDVNHIGLNSSNVNNYGVHLDYSDYTLYGYALHDEFGLISFRNGTPDNNYSFLSNCSETTVDDCKDENNCSACYDGGYDYEQDQSRSQRVYGWAYVVEADEWIELHSDKIENESDRTKILDFTSSDAGDFEGYFYHDNWGAVDLNECYPNLFACDPSDPYYKVYVGKLELAQMSAPNWGPSKTCSLSSSALGAVLKWDVHGGHIDKYEIKINNSNNFNTAIDIPMAPGLNKREIEIGDIFLDWNSSYTWWLKLHDETVYNTSTDWIQFDHSGTADVKGILTHNETENTSNSFAHNLTFTTYKHEWPRPYFTWEGHPASSFIAGAANRFEVSASTKYYTGPGVSVNFGGVGFIENFNWWGTIGGDVSDKITIVDASEFPDAKTPVFRLDASSITGLENNQLIETWEDTSGGTNYHVAQTESSKSPKYSINALNGRPAVYFDGNDSMLNSSLNVNQPFTVFVVAQSEDSLNNAYLFDSNIPDVVSLGYSSDNKYLMWAGEALAGGSVDDNLSLWTAYYSGYSSSLQIKQRVGENVVTVANISNPAMLDFTNNISGIRIGSSINDDKYWKGYIAEVLIYSVTLSDNERDEIEDYLALKWGIDENTTATAPQVDVYFESIKENQKIWLSLTDPSEYTCSTSTSALTINYNLPLWREVRARE